MNTRLTLLVLSAIVMLVTIVTKVFGAMLHYLDDVCHACVAVSMCIVFLVYTRICRKAYIGYLAEIAFAVSAGIITKKYNTVMQPHVVALICFISCMIVNYTIDFYLHTWSKISMTCLKNRTLCCSSLSILSIVTCALMPNMDLVKTEIAQSLPQLEQQFEPFEVYVANGAAFLSGDEPEQNQNVVLCTPITSHFDVTTPHYVSAHILNKVLAGVLEGKGQLFMDEGEKHNISPAFLAAISIHESGNGTSPMARKKNNVMGVYGKGSYRSFDTVEDCVTFMSGKLASYYVGRGKKTITEIQKIYAPVGADNDPKNLNGEWTKGVVHYLNKIIKESTVDSGNLASIQ